MGPAGRYDADHDRMSAQAAADATGLISGVLRVVGAEAIIGA